jgi:bifunctional DNase/RNase
MVKVKVESIRVSLMNQQRLVVLREADSSRYLPIWIGAFEAEAITMGMQGTEIQRPLTHDLLRGAIKKLGATLEHILISKLEEETFYAQLVLDADGEKVEVDARPSDAIALAVRADVPIYVDDDVMEAAGQMPAESAEGDSYISVGGKAGKAGKAGDDDDDEGEVEEEELDVFRDFFDSLDMGEGSAEDVGD